MFGSEDWICMFGSEDCSDAESVCMAMLAGSWDTTESELVVLGQLGLQWLVVVILQILWRGSKVLQVAVGQFWGCSCWQLGCCS